MFIKLSFKTNRESPRQSPPSKADKRDSLEEHAAVVLIGVAIIKYLCYGNVKTS
jgi:hypothetical protein